MNQFHANMELQHIYLEVYAERFHYLRHFIEAYYCYQHGLITNKGKADWEAIFEHGTRSFSASKVSNRKRLVREMLLPLSVITGMLKTLVRDDEANIEQIQSTLDQHLHYVIITREEHLALKKAGLSERMPAGFYQQDTDDYQDPYSRFNAVNICFD